MTRRKQVTPEFYFRLATLPWRVTVHEAQGNTNIVWLTSYDEASMENKAPRLSDGWYKYYDKNNEKWMLLHCFSAKWSEKRMRAYIYRPVIRVPMHKRQ